METKYIHPTAKRLYEAAEKLLGIEEKHRQAKIAKLLVVSPQVVKNWESRGVSKEGMIQAQKSIGCRIEWIKDGEPPISSELPKISATHQLKTQKIPIVAHAKLGDEENYFVDLEYPVGSGDGYINYASKDSNAYALRCFGDSMKPRIRHGEYVVVEPNHPVMPGDEVLVKDRKGRVMIKVWNYTRDGLVYFSSVNETFQPFSIPEEDLEKMQYVAAIAKSSLKVEE